MSISEFIKYGRSGAVLCADMQASKEQNRMRMPTQRTVLVVFKQMSNTAKMITFDYNHEGLRVRKTVNDTADGIIVTDYTLHGKTSFT